MKLRTTCTTSITPVELVIRTELDLGARLPPLAGQGVGLISAAWSEALEPI
jgi:hypothetical protein